MGTSLPPWLMQSHFGRTNALVPEEQKKEIRLHLQRAHDGLHDIRNRIKILQRQEEDLTAQIDRCKVAIAPHKQLPADVLSYTFAICFDQYTVFPLSKTNMLLVLTQVCSAWRRIAHETSSFWSNIAVSRRQALEDYHFSSPHLRSSLDLWVKCAAGRPLSLKVYDERWGDSYVSRKRFIEFVISLLSWLDYRKLEISIDLAALRELKSHIPPYRLRQLEALSLINTHSGPFADSEDLSFPPNITFECLTSLNLKGEWDLRSNHIQSAVPWKNMRHLVLLQHLPPIICLQVLQQTRVLEYCHMVLSMSGLTTEVERLQVHLPHLRTLRISCITTSGVEIFMDHLVLPALEYVTCDRLNQVKGAILNAVVRLSRRSGTPKVKEVNIYDSPSGLQFQDLLRSMPHLQVIRFTKSAFTFDDDTLERLATGELGPCLNELEANFKHDEDDARIADMLRRRRECPRALNKEVTPIIVLKPMFK